MSRGREGRTVLPSVPSQEGSATTSGPAAALALAVKVIARVREISLQGRVLLLRLLAGDLPDPRHRCLFKNKKEVKKKKDARARVHDQPAGRPGDEQPRAAGPDGAPASLLRAHARAPPV